MSRSDEFALGQGTAYHGTDAASARLISGERVGRANEEPIIRLGLDIVGNTNVSGGEDRFKYPRLYGPGLYVTSNRQHAEGYAEDNKTAGLVAGRLSAKNPVSMTMQELHDMSDDPKIQKVAGIIARTRPHLSVPMHTAASGTGSDPEELLNDVVNYEHYENTPSWFKNSVISAARTQPPKEGIDWQFARTSNGRIVSGADVAAANLALRSMGHEFLHVPATPKSEHFGGGDYFKDSGVVIKRGAFSPVSAEFWTGRGSR